MELEALGKHGSPLRSGRDGWESVRFCIIESQDHSTASGTNVPRPPTPTFDPLSRLRLLNGVAASEIRYDIVGVAS